VLETRHSPPASPSWAVSGGGDPHKIPIDPNGNLATKTEGSDVWGYEWNAENQLIRVTKNSVEQARFAYDPIGRRVEKTAGGVTTGYVHDERHVAEERLSTGGTLRYFHGLLADDWLGRQNADGSMTYFETDALGSIVAETNSAGAVTLTRSYDTWGNLDAASAAVGGAAFTGRWWEPEVQLYDYRARWLAPKLGRFISEDPVGFEAGVNFYAYALNNPVRYTDPSGLDVYACERPAEGMGGIPHGLSWSTKCNKSYSFGPGLKGGKVRTDDNPFDPTGKVKPPYQCFAWSSKECYEDCVCQVIEAHSKKPPWWGPTNMCWDQRNKVDIFCTERCKGK
jgi:RHS repeat-associated protein